jgi:polyribonucleotide nucleotidyltransferase
MHTTQVNVGRSPLIIETGKLAKQADGAVTVRYGDTVVIVTACAASQAREGIDFLPLTVDYREYAYASGRIPGGFFKREAKPTEKEVLTSRLIDRPLRPLFPEGWGRETQVIAFLLSADPENDSDVLALTGASAALSISSIPFSNPIAAVRVGFVEDKIVINPTFSERKLSALDLIIAGSSDAIMMVEAGAKEVTEDTMLKALEEGHAAIREIVSEIEKMASAIGKQKTEVVGKSIDPAIKSDLESQVLTPLTEAMRVKDKIDSYAQVDSVYASLVESISEDDAEKQSAVSHVFKELKEKILRDEVLERGQRLDGRRFDEVRDIWSEVSVLPRVHGSAVFTRGETQALVTATLGTADDQQKIESVDGESYKRFMLHYNFPPFSVGEVKFLRGPGRREIGHGNLAERSLAPMVPTEEAFPYTVRVVSDILESNGSSSMATVCGGTLAMMDAGVPLVRPVAGIAMGLILDEENGRHAVLSDIAGAEDHYGDMDFKVAGTSDGITALQMDIKVSGITTEIMKEALAQAREGRLHILEKMGTTIASPRESISTHAPRIITIQIPVGKIRDVIGPGGKTIRGIVAQTGVKVDVEDDGRVNVASTDETSAQKAISIIEELTASPEVDKTYLGKVQRITDFGAFVEILPGIDGLLHVSEIAHYRVNDVRKELNEGDQVMVKVINVDPSGKVRLSRKALLPGGEDAGNENKGDDGDDSKSSDRPSGRSGPGNRSRSSRSRKAPR